MHNNIDRIRQVWNKSLLIAQLASKMHGTQFIFLLSACPTYGSPGGTFLLITYHLLLTTYYLLLITYYLSLITYYLSLITYYLLLIISYINPCNGEKLHCTFPVLAVAVVVVVVAVVVVVVRYLIWDFRKLPFPSHLGKYFITTGKISAKIHEIGKKTVFALGMICMFV